MGFMQLTRFYIGVIGFFLAALVFAGLFFITGMNDASYLVSDGAGYGLHYIDKPRYDSHLQGLIFAISFLGAGLLLVLLMVLPDQAGAAAQVQPSAPPQPRRRAAAPQSAAVPQPQQVAAPQPAATQEPEPQPAAAAGQSTVEIESPAAEGGEAEPPPPSVDAEVKIAAQEEETTIEDIPDSRFDDTGDEDVVYGNGRVTDDSIWEYIHDYPDSAVKFLYRKSLENKPLTPNDEDIYRKWELRGMTRAKVREYVLEIMGWKALPDDFPHNIWRGLRDQIFELKARIAS